MNRNERIKILRKKLEMSQEEFGKLLGITKSGVSDIEAGRRAVTEQHIIMLCDVAKLSPRINAEWLRSGTGEMFLPADGAFSIDELISARGASDIERQIIRAWFELAPEERTHLLEHFKAHISASPVEQAEDEYIKSRSENAQRTGQSASNTKGGTGKEAV